MFNLFIADLGKQLTFLCINIMILQHCCNHFISSSSFLSFVLNFCMLSVNKDSFIFSPICICFISLACLIVVARMSSVILNNGMKRHPCLITDLSGDAQVFHR